MTTYDMTDVLEAMEKAQVVVTVRARTAAIAWLNAFLAASQEDARPVLYRTLCMEWFDTGVQFIGCDGTALFRTWVPAILQDEEGDAKPLADWPALDARPRRSVVIMDPDAFGLAFMRALLRVTGDDGHLFADLQITTAPYDDETELALGDEFNTERVTLRACGQRIDLRVFDGPYVGWRHLKLGIEDVERVDGMTVPGRLLAMVGKLKGAGAVDLDFHGTDRHIGFTARGETVVRGVIAPMRRPARENDRESDRESDSETTTTTEAHDE